MRRQYRLVLKKPIRFELHRQWPGHIEYSSEHPTTLFDYRTVVAVFDLGARSRAHYPFTVVTRNGTRATQNKVFLAE